MYSKQRESSVLCNSNKSSESKTSFYANSLTAHGFPALHPCLTMLRSKEARMSKLYIIFPSSRPLGWISKSQLYSWAKCKYKGNPGNPSMSLLNYPPGVVSELQPILDPCQDKSLASKSCPVPSTRRHKSGLWKLGIAHASTVMSSLGSGGEGCGLSCFPKDTYYRQMVLLCRSKAALRLLLLSLIGP